MRATFNGIIAKYTSSAPSVVTLDAVTTGGTQVSSYSHTCSGTNRCLVLLVTCAASSPTSITYGGVEMTREVQRVGSSNISSVWYLANPSSGSNTVSITTSNYINNTIAVSFTNVHQSTPIRANGSAFGNTFSAQPNVLISGFVTNDMTIGVAMSEGGGTLASDGQTTTGTSTGSMVGNRSASGGTLNWSGASSNWSVAGVILRPA